MTQPAYPPYQQPMRPMMGAPVQPKPSRGGVTALVAGLLALVVAGLAVGGSFGDIAKYRNSYVTDDGDERVHASASTWWMYSEEGSTARSTEDGTGTLVGLTLVLAAALLVVGAVFAFMASRSRRPGAVSGMRSLISAGVGVLAGVSLLQLIPVLKSMSFYNERELEAGESLEFSAGLGLWLPLGGLVLGLVAVVLAHVGQRAAAVRVEPNTPRMGFPAPYGYRPQQMPVAERPTDVQPDGDDATTTQRVSGATASGTFAPVTPPPAPLTPATTSAPEAATQPGTAAPAAPSTGETPAPVTPATTAEPMTAASPATPSEPAAPAAPAAPSGGEAPAPVTPATTSAPEPVAAPEPADAPAPPAAPEPPAAPAPADAPAKPGDESRSALSDFPAAPPAPEPSDDDKTGK